MKYCPYCGAGLDADMRFCPKCGKPFEGGKENPHTTAKHLKPESPAYDYAPVSKQTKKKKRGGIIALVIVAVLIAVGVGLYFSGVFAPKEEPKLPFADNPAAIAEASNSVVMLNCYDKDGELFATGSAFAAFEDGVFVTNYHVLEGKTFSIVAKTESGEEFNIHRVVANNAAADVAIIRSDKKIGLATLPIGSSSRLEKGEKVTAIGSPLGLINTVSEGLYSGIVKDNEQSFLQFSAAISHGSSGGALFNSNGELVGITSASYANGQNLNLAIPIETVVEMWDNHFDSTSMSLEKFYSLQEHIVSIDELYMDIDYYLSENAPKKITIEGFISDVDKEKLEILLVNSMDSAVQYKNAVVVTNVGRLQIQGLSSGEHIKLSGKILTPLVDDYLYIDGKLSKITPLE